MKNNELQLFDFESNNVRVVLLENEPWFVAMDVAKVLGYVDPSMMLKHVDDDDRQIVNPQKLDSVEMTESFGSNTFKVSIINESGLYACIFGSNKPDAKRFKKWVTSEVLPQIRKTGGYQPKPMTSLESLLATVQQLVEVERKQQELEQRTDNLETLVHQHDNEIDRIFNPSGHYYSIMGFCRLKGKPISVKHASTLGKEASKLCKEQGFKIVKLTDPRFGEVNSYPDSVLNELI